MDVLMPQLGETVAEGRITAWFKSVGDAVRPGDTLFEIETDKVSMEVPATAGGTLAEIRVAAGEVAPVGAVLAVLGAGADVRAPADAALAAQPAAARASSPRASRAVPVPGQVPAPAALRAPSLPAPQAPAARQTGGAVRSVMLDPFREVRTPARNYGPARLATGSVVTPLARRLAGEAGIDLAAVAASGPGGRIVGRDIENAIAAAGSGRPAPNAGEPSAARVKALYEPGSYEEVVLDAARATITPGLAAARSVPHFYLTADLATDRLSAVREEANAAALPDAAGQPAFRLSLNDFIVKALALALQRVPNANAVWAQDRILRFRRSDIGVAVAIEGGVVAPVIRGAETKSIRALSAEIRDLARRARARTLKPAEFQGGASAVANLGMRGIREFAAVVTPPHATVLAVGAAARRPIEAEDGGVRFAGRMTVTLSCDHRVIDGALGADLLDALRHFIEHPVGMLI